MEIVRLNLSRDKISSYIIVSGKDAYSSPIYSRSIKIPGNGLLFHLHGFSRPNQLFILARDQKRKPKGSLVIEGHNLGKGI